MSEASRIPSRKEGLLERSTGDAIVVMKETGDVVHTLEGTALFIWSILDGLRSIDAIADELTIRYDVDLKEAVADTEKFIAQLSENGLINIG